MDERQQQGDFEFYSALYVDQGYSKEDAEEKARSLVEMMSGDNISD